MSKLFRTTDTYGRHSELGGEGTVDVFTLINTGGLHPSYLAVDYVGAHRALWWDAQVDR